MITPAATGSNPSGNLYIRYMADDRYRAKNNRDRMRKRMADWKKRDEKEAEAENSRGNYRCADCRNYLSLREFEYVFEGETKVARRCKDCRTYRRKHRGQRRRY